MGEQGAFTQMAVACKILYLVGLSIDFILSLALVSWLHFALTRLKYTQTRTVVAAWLGGAIGGCVEWAIILTRRVAALV